jgi:hypothetical protein
LWRRQETWLVDGRWHRPGDVKRVGRIGQVAQGLAVGGPGITIGAEVVVGDLRPVARLQQLDAPLADLGVLRLQLIEAVGTHHKSAAVPVDCFQLRVALGALVRAGVARTLQLARREGGAVGAGAAVHKADAVRQGRWGGLAVGVEHCQVSSLPEVLRS